MRKQFIKTVTNLFKKDAKIKANDGHKLLEKRRSVRVHTLNNLKSMINKIKK